MRPQDAINVKLAREEVYRQLKKYDIKVTQWNKTPCGSAHYETKTITIPKPTSVTNICVGFHEIRHIMLKDSIESHGSYYEEYECEKYALKQAKKFNLDATLYKVYAQRYVLKHLSEFHNKLLKKNKKGIDLRKIKKEIRLFCGINLKEWKGKKVSVHNFSAKPLSDLKILLK